VIATLGGDHLRERNRRTARILLLIVFALAVGALLVGIRW